MIDVSEDIRVLCGLKLYNSVFRKVPKLHELQIGLGTAKQGKWEGANVRYRTFTQVQ
jgi:hypothetical protein